MGSAKDVIELPEEVKAILGPGYKAFLTLNKFSVFDLKDYIKDKIPLKDFSLCMQTAKAFEILEDNGIKTHYGGLLDENNKVIRINDLGRPSNKLVFKFYDFLDDKVVYNKDRGTYDYSFFEKNRGKIDKYVILIEWVFRNGAPEGSSLFRKTFPKWLAEEDTASIERFLRRTGLTELPKPGDMFKKTIYDFWTKAEPEDRFVGDDEDYEEAYIISGLTRDQFLEVEEADKRATKILAAYLKSVGIEDYDGKKEWAWDDGPVLVDFACTVDEDRWLRKKRQISKELLRLYMEKRNPKFYKHLNECKAEAKELRREDFRELLKMEVPRYPKHILELVGKTYAAATDIVTKNNMFGDIYGVEPLDNYLGEIDKVVAELKAIEQQTQSKEN